jgi:hypothetical protein
MPRNVQWNIIGNRPSTIHMDLANDLTLKTIPCLQFASLLIYGPFYKISHKKK